LTGFFTHAKLPLIFLHQEAAQLMSANKLFAMSNGYWVECA